MNMDNAESLNKYFDKVQTLVEKTRQFQENKDETEQLAEILGEELKLSREKESRLRDEIKTLLETCNTFSSLNFIDLKDNVRKLEEENNKLKTEIIDLIKQFDVEKTRLKEQHEEKIQLLTDQYNEATQKVTEDMRLVKEDCEQQKQQLYAEIQLLQAQAAMQCDTVETKYFGQITDLNNKLRQVNLFNTNLRSEIQNMKAQYSILLYNKEQVIYELENKLKIAEKSRQESRVTLGSRLESGQKNLNSNVQAFSSNDESNNLQNFCNIESEFEIHNATASTSTTFDKNKTVFTTAGLNAKGVGDKNKTRSETDSKYPPLEVTKYLPKTNNAATEVDEFEDFEIIPVALPTRIHVPKIYTGGSRSAYRGVGKSANALLPPLKQYSNAKVGVDSKTTVPKKRKLLNPDDLDYLNKIDGPD